MNVYYNDAELYCTRWLENLAVSGSISRGLIDSRPIQRVSVDNVKTFTRCHFFAGIGGWELALRLAGWPADREVWTGSCPCQPFSISNPLRSKQADARDLWPAWFQLIRQCRPATIFGEQVSQAIADGWLDRLVGDLESEAYIVASAVLPSCSVGAVHKRDRLYYVAYTLQPGRERHQPLQRLSLQAGTAPAIDCDPLIRARMPLAGDYRSLLLDDGVSITVERAATKGYGNAIVPQVAATFIRAFMEAE